MKTNKFYTKQIEVTQQEINKVSKKITYAFYVRFALFLLVFFFIWQILSTSELIYKYGLALLLVSFAFAIRYNSKLNKCLHFLQNKSSIYQKELNFLNYTFQNYPNGAEYSELDAHLSNDLDIFGQNSIYQFINRSSTVEARKLFATKLCFPERNKEKINENQESIKELSEKITFLTDFQAIGMDINENGKEKNNLIAWLNETSPNNKFLPILLSVLPPLTLASIFSVAFGILPFSIITTCVLVNFFVIGLFFQQIKTIHAHLGNIAGIFKMYYQLLSLIEKEQFETSNKNSQQELKKDAKSASEELKKLFQLLESLDVRFNVLAALFLDGLFIYDLQIIYRLEKWKKRNRESVQNWINTLFEMDSKIGFAVYSFNFQEYLTPARLSSSELLKCEDLGHLLIPQNKCIRNNFSIKQRPDINIITGANMAGKSTFLKTIGVNLILAMNGAPVCAKTFEFQPVFLLTSIKIDDSLFRNESYFYAELKRLHEIIEHVGKHPDSILIFDEILRGTNTKDKQSGTIGLIHQLIDKQTTVVIATHDLIIGEMQHEFPEIVHNYCFEVELQEDKLVFDYKLKNGISQKLNATWLMKKMGII